MEKSQKDEKQQVVYHPDFFVIHEDGKKPYLMGFKCEDCGSAWFPKLPICPKCWSDKLTKFPISRVAKLYSYTIINVPQPGLKAPIAVGFVDFPEGVRVAAQIDMGPDKMNEIKIGMDLEVAAGVVRQDSNGSEVISYKFMPLR